MIQAAQKTKRSDGRFMRFYERIARRRGPNKAAVALAREMLVIMWHMLTKNELYRDCDVRHWKEKLKKMRSISKK